MATCEKEVFSGAGLYIVGCILVAGYSIQKRRGRRGVAPSVSREALAKEKERRLATLERGEAADAVGGAVPR